MCIRDSLAFAHCKQAAVQCTDAGTRDNIRRPAQLLQRLPHTHQMCIRASSRQAPAAVAVHWAVGVRLAPYSSGVRNCRSAEMCIRDRYSILQLPCGETLLPDGTLNTALQTLDSRMVPQPYYRGSVIFYGN